MKEENEHTVAWLLKNFEEAIQMDVHVSWGRPGLETQGMDASKVRRIFPMDGGEGHFIAKFQKKVDDSVNTPSSLPFVKSKKLPPAVTEFLKTQTTCGFHDYYTESSKEGVRVYGMNHPFISLKKDPEWVLIINLVENKGFEPLTPCVQGRCSSQLS